MEKPKVVIASLLKPIDNTRMFEKFGLSMAETNKYDINIIGFESKNARAANHITTHSLGNFNRASLTRFFKPWKVFRILVNVKPKVYIVNSHDLLIVTSIYKILFGGVFIYDIRENYQKNILNTTVFHKGLRPLIATYVRLKEWLSKPLIQHYILAEKIYQRQLPFIGSRFTILENKYMPLEDHRTAYRNPDPSSIDLVFTGTISEGNGVFDAIEITRELYALNNQIKLRIVGYCALKNDLLRLKETIQALDYIELNGGDHLVPHSEIIEAIEKADFGFVLKKPNNGVNDDKLLTRLFEYTANQLPIIALDNPTWVEFCSQFNAAIHLNRSNYSPEDVLKDMQQKTFYDSGDTSSSLWSTEAPKLINLIDSLI